MNKSSTINNSYKYSELTSKVIQCGIKVHKTLGTGFQEVIYQRALKYEFMRHSIRNKREFEMPIFYEGIQIGTRRVDFLVEDLLSVELKAVVELEKVHLAQAINYLEVYNLEVGLLLNFGETQLNIKRLQNKKYDAELGPGNRFKK